MTFLQTGLGKAASATGYQIARSLRFNSADSAYLNRTPGSTTNQKTFTWSGWLKRGSLGGGGCIFGAGNSGTNFCNLIYASSTDTLSWFTYEGSTSTNLVTTQVLRDPSAFHHLVLSVDTTQATSSNRAKLYLNGVQITAFGTATYPAQNTNHVINTSAIPNGVGAQMSPSAAVFFNGYMAEVYFIDGQQLDPTSFGELDANTGVWMPKQVTGMTYGTNGFYLKFNDNSNTTAATLGKDSSGNSNNWTPNNFSVTAGVGNDSLVDSPTNYGTDTGVGGEVRGNYCTLNPLDNGGNTLADGNLSGSKGGGWTSTRATMACPTTGKWYWEAVITAGGNNMTVGIATSAAALSGDIIGRDTNGWGYVSGNGQKWTNGLGASYGATWTAGDIIGIAFDAGAGTLTFYKNNTSQGTAFSSLTGGPYFPGVSFESTTGYVNFGQRPFAYTAPSGFKALCTQNLPTPAIGATSSTLASKNFDATLYTGTGASLSVTNAGAFQPDWVWLKSRSNAQDNKLTDVLRGVTKGLISNSTGAETTDTNGLTAFNSGGFTVGSDATYNTNAATYVGWQWKANGTGASNTNGSITSTVSANTTAGFSLVSYTGNNTAGATVGHGLGVAPKMIIAKSRGVENWGVYHASLGSTTGLLLNNTGASIAAAWWNSSAPTSSTFSLSSGSGITNTNAQAYIAYCFAEVAGFSKFGSYVGNGSADGPFVYCGFRPRYVMIKRTDAAGDNWFVHDTARNTYNVVDLRLYPNTSGAEASNITALDIVSNGFKLRTSDTSWNASGGTYIFMAFAEAPFNYSRAR